MWQHPHEAYWAGFLDGFHSRLDTSVSTFHRDYELGFIMGWAAKHRNPSRNPETEK